MLLDIYGEYWEGLFYVIRGVSKEIT